MSYRSELAIHATATADREAATGRLIQVAIDAAITETLTDLRERLARAQQNLSVLADNSERGGDPLDVIRLRGKVEGVKLTLSYVDEALRAQPTGGEETQPMTQFDTIAREGASSLRGQQVITCADGFTFSVNASRGGYCTPRSDTGPYASVEVGYPSGSVPADWQQYAAPESGDIFGWVPVETVRALIDSHGGEVRS